MSHCRSFHTQLPSRSARAAEHRRRVAASRPPLEPYDVLAFFRLRADAREAAREQEERWDEMAHDLYAYESTLRMEALILAAELQERRHFAGF